jgi:hypothetical protein
MTVRAAGTMSTTSAGGDAGVVAEDLVEVVEFDQERVVAAGQDPHHRLNGLIVTPAPSNADRTRRAMSTAPGVSPWTQIDAGSTVSDPPALSWIG